MNRAWVLAGVHRRKFLALTALGFVGLAGCHGMPWSEKEKVQGRSQIGEDPIAELDASTTVGSEDHVGNTESILVSGVGLVYHLPGTGSSAPPGGWRHDARGQPQEEPARCPVTSANCSTTRARPPRSSSSRRLIPPGARKGDPIDVQITLPDESKTTSLKGGVLHPCELFTSDTTGNLQSMVREGKPAAPSGDLKIGDMWAMGEGPVLAGQFVPTNGKSDRSRRTPTASRSSRSAASGAARRSSSTRPYFILLNPGDQNPRTACDIAERLNTTFHATVGTEPEGRRGEDPRTHPRERAVRVPAQPLPLPAGRPAGADSAHGRGQRVPAEARGRTARPADDADRGGQARSAGRRAARGACASGWKARRRGCGSPRPRR